MKITDYIKRYFPMEIVILAVVMGICIIVNLITLNGDPDNSFVYISGNASWWIGNLCFWLIAASIILRMFTSEK